MTGSVTRATDGATMSLTEHLGELRRRLLRAILAIGAGTAVGFYFSREIRTALVLLLPTQRVQVLEPGEAFGITVRISLVVGIALAMPVVLYQLWAFVAPGLTAGERRALRMWIPLAVVFFAMGLAIAWTILPFALQFLLSFTDEYVRGDAFAAGSYFEFVTTLFLAFGLVLEYPIVLIALSRVGIISSGFLARQRRLAIVGIAVFAAVATPGGDLVSPAILGLTMIGLYELTIRLIRRSGR